MSNNYTFDSIRVKSIVGEILSRANAMTELLMEQKFDTDEAYYHIRWYINGARDVMLLDNSISTNDFSAANKSFDDFMSNIVDAIGYNKWSDEI